MVGARRRFLERRRLAIYISDNKSAFDDYFFVVQAILFAGHAPEHSERRLQVCAHSD